MKQVFDWLREQMGKIIGEVHSPADVVWNNAVKMCISKIDEAEAKWEAEVCEWKPNKGWTGMIISPHEPHSALWTADLKLYPYCNHCGKRIKISEVE